MQASVASLVPDLGELLEVAGDLAIDSCSASTTARTDAKASAQERLFSLPGR